MSMILMRVAIAATTLGALWLASSGPWKVP